MSLEEVSGIIVEAGEKEEVKTEVKNEDVERKETSSLGVSFQNHRKLVDYSSESSSQDSECDNVPASAALPKSSSSSESDDGSSEDEIEEIVQNVEEVLITAPSDQCKEVGRVKTVLANQVIVEANIGIAALDLDTVLFLDEGRQPFGRVGDVFGPITEPLYSVFLPSVESVTAKGIVPGLQVFYAPSMDHTSYVMLPDLIKMRGSDASWKNNQEAPAEFQEYSDDEEEAKALGYISGRRGARRKGRPYYPKKASLNMRSTWEKLGHRRDPIHQYFGGRGAYCPITGVRWHTG